ncbi:hypothetical protein WJ968_24715 [Achromobacter xylosoxidans]
MLQVGQGQFVRPVEVVSKLNGNGGKPVGQVAVNLRFLVVLQRFVQEAQGFQMRGIAVFEADAELFHCGYVWRLDGRGSGPDRSQTRFIFLIIVVAFNAATTLPVNRHG